MQPRVTSSGGGEGDSLEDLMYIQAGEFLEQLPKKIKVLLGENPKPLEVFRR